ncbi:hypothetical protein EV06_1517 [Prochlorococcus sp. MIT 0602]|nr:hypothetical protein EV06_1517 [Prochlorococcus sp. MIT 0602]
MLAALNNKALIKPCYSQGCLMPSELLSLINPLNHSHT